jgi:hypothetical protein
LEAISGGAKVDKEDARTYKAKMDRLQQWVLKNREAIDRVFGWTSYFLGGIEGLYNQAYSNRTTEIDNENKQKQDAIDAEYERRKKDIEDSTLSEEEKQTALAALDKEYKDAKELAEKEYEAKKKKLQKEAAEKNKALAIIQAVINTAEAVTKAWALGPIIGPILAALTMAMGMAQIAIIKSQAIPLAKGAMFDRPTLLGSGRYEVGDAGKEAVLPVEPLMKRIEAAVARRTGDNLQITVPIYLDGQKIDQRTIKLIKKEGSLGRFKLDSKVVS